MGGQCISQRKDQGIEMRRKGDAKFPLPPQYLLRLPQKIVQNVPEKPLCLVCTPLGPAALLMPERDREQIAQQFGKADVLFVKGTS